MLKVGDKVVIYARPAYAKAPRHPVRIVTVKRITKTLAICGPSRFDRIPVNHEPATPEDLETVRAELDRHKQHRQIQIDATAARRADPLLSTADWIRSSADFHPWEKLTLEQLQTIRRWLEEAENK